MKEKIKRFYKRIKTGIETRIDNLKNKVTSSPAYVRLLQIRDKLAKPVLSGLLAFFNFLAPCWMFFCIKKHDFNGENELRNEIS